MSGGQQVTILENPSRPDSSDLPALLLDDPRRVRADNVPISQLNATPKHKTLTIYLQDRWAVLPNLTLNLGVRWDNQQIIDDSGVQQINLDNDFAPRIGVIWDPEDHKTKVFGSFGYFYEQIPMDLVIRSFSFEQQPVIYNFDPVRASTPDHAAEADFGRDRRCSAASPSRRIRTSRVSTREFLFGVEREIFPNFAVGAKFIYRDYGRVIEDFLCSDDGTYCIGNPGGESRSNVFTLDYAHQFLAPEAAADLPRRSARRDEAFLGQLVDARFLPLVEDGRQLRRRLRPVHAAPAPDPNISAAYDYYDFFTHGQRPRATITNRGPAHNDRRTSSSSRASTSRRSSSRSDWSPTTAPGRRSPARLLGRVRSVGVLPDPRGSDGRLPADYETDVHLGYPLALGPVTVNFLARLFHLLNAQRATFSTRPTTFREFEDALHLRIGPANGRRECNPVLQDGVPRPAPRSLRLGARISF